VAIGCAVILVTLVSATNNWQQQRKFRAVDVSRELDPVTVIRSAVQLSIRPEEILVGDMVVLAAGQRIPADGIMVHMIGQSLDVNESTATGETGVVHKMLTSAPLLMSGTEVVSGTCVMLVLLVGIHTVYGQTLASLVEPVRETPLQKKLRRVAKLIGIIGALFATATFIALTAYWLSHNIGQHGGKPSVADWSNFLDIAVVCISIVVVAVPEGLPLAVTISLAYSMDAMRNDHILVRELSACETMGNVTTVCSDKTGTLTQNRMSVLRAYLQQTQYDRLPQKAELTEATLCLLEHCIILNSAAWIEDQLVLLSVPPQDWKWKDGNQTEVALLSWLICYGIDVNAVRLKHSPQRKLTEPFDSIKKYSSIVFKKTEQELKQEGREAKPYRQYFKGAAEVIISNSNRQVDKFGLPVPLRGSGGNMHRELLETVSQFSRRGLRVLGFSYRDLNELPKPKNTVAQITEEVKKPQQQALKGAIQLTSNQQTAEKESVKEQSSPPITDAVLIGMVALADPLRPSSYRSVRQCQRAGIIVRMVTGDHVSHHRERERDLVDKDNWYDVLSCVTSICCWYVDCLVCRLRRLSSFLASAVS
jgi:Ca2+-transporting ATPase